MANMLTQLGVISTLEPSSPVDVSLHEEDANVILNAHKVAVFSPHGRDSMIPGTLLSDQFTLTNLAVLC